MSTPLPNDISLDGLNFTRAREGRALRAYQDPVGVWTIGFGLTNYDKNLPWKIQSGLTITDEQAEWYLLRSIRANYLPGAKRALEGGTYEHPQGALDGATDFHFNTGGIAKATWPAALGRGDMETAKQSMMAWNKAGGRVLAGLTKRRAGNWKQVSEGDYGELHGPAGVGGQTGGKVLTALPVEPDSSAGGSVKVDGIPQPTTAAPGTLSFGMRGPEVLEIQNALTAAGYPTVATGTYDQDTVASVEAFQGAHPNLTKDGKVGPATRAAIVRAVAMRGVGGKIIKTAVPGLPGLFIAFHQWVSANAGWLALMIGGTVFAGVAGYYLWKHRFDVRAWVNGVLKRNVQ